MSSYLNLWLQILDAFRTLDWKKIEEFHNKIEIANNLIFIHKVNL